MLPIHQRARGGRRRVRDCAHVLQVHPRVHPNPARAAQGLHLHLRLQLCVQPVCSNIARTLLFTFSRSVAALTPHVFKLSMCVFHGVWVCMLLAQWLKTLRL